ncbi:hypothetical protein EMIT0180MI3_110027 [Priestia megaterium]
MFSILIFTRINAFSLCYIIAMDDISLLIIEFTLLIILGLCNQFFAYPISS